MKVLGLSGGTDVCRPIAPRFPVDLDGYWHDASAVLIDGGVVASAHEEERHSRVKNSTGFPTRAVRACLTDHGIGLGAIDAIAVYFTERYWEHHLALRMGHDKAFECGGARDLIVSNLQQSVPGDLEPEKIHFVRHHLAHAASAWMMSGFEHGLVLTLDGAGDDESGVLWRAEGDDLAELMTVPIEDSLGSLYLWAARFLGYGQFDEYKVMGLAAYGDCQAFGRSFQMVELLSGGRFRIDWSFAAKLLHVARPRRAGEPLSAFHADVAATVQDALEEAVLHMLRHAQHMTGEENLCLAGGVAHNCSMNGAVARTEKFRRIFVQPASHDAGCALGAALHVDHNISGHRPCERVRHVFWGSRTRPDEVTTSLRAWRDLVHVEEPEDTCAIAADAIANGGLVAWVQGRAEFGPRALGHRSLLADCRVIESRERINRCVKRRSDYRPLAPVVHEERAAEYFEIPDGIDCSFMSFALTIRPEWRERLAAVTHADGTARVQTVNRSQDERLYELLTRMDALIGFPILLNTSLNVSGEPIVDSVEDAITFLLTTPVEILIVGDLLVTRADPLPLESLAVSLPADGLLSRVGNGEWSLERGAPGHRRAALSESAFEILRRADGQVPLADLADGGVAATSEIIELWSTRMVSLVPAGRRAP